MASPVKLETLKLLARGVAEKHGISPEQATLQLIHEQGFDNVDFSGGHRADPNDGTVLLQ